MVPLGTGSSDLMSNREDREFAEWLQAKIEDANLSGDEIAELKSWLASPKSKKDDISTSDIKELFVWLGKRVGAIAMDRRDRQELADWLAKELKSKSKIDEDKIEKLKRKFSDYL